jgi:uncharacterized lipoprotein YbaY
MKQTRSLMVAALASITLAGCSGSSDYTPAPAPVPPPANVVPPAAQADVPSLIVYMKQKAASTDEAADAVDVAGATLPVSEVAEPDGSI